jgi:hypothetical protein
VGGCRGALGSVSGRFDTTFVAGPLQPSPEAPGVEAALTIDGRELEATWFGAAGRDPAGADPTATVQLLGVTPDQKTLFIVLQLPPAAMAPGRHPFYNFETVGFAAYSSPAAPAGALLGFVSEGAVTFEAASLTPGAPITGSVEGQVFQTSCLE